MILIPVVSRPTVDFIAGLAAAGGVLTPPFAGSAIYNLLGVPPNGSRRFFVRAIGMTAVENVGIEFDFHSAAAGGFLGRWQFPKAEGIQLNGANLYNYYVDGLAIPYADSDTAGTPSPPTLHVAAQNIDTVAKSAGAGGALNVTFWLEAMQETQGSGW